MRHWKKLYACVLLILLASSIVQIVSILRPKHVAVAAIRPKAGDITIATTRPISLMEGIGRVEHPVSTRIAEAQAFFNQGLALCYGFDKPNAAASFKQAEQIDPHLAMAYWGEAYALGPDINFTASAAAKEKGLVALRMALKHINYADTVEQAYINALAKRFPLNGKATTAQLNHAYADAMRELSSRYPDDLDATVLYAESVMDLTPWHLWTKDGESVPGSEPIIPALQSVLRRDRDHLGANHFLVHAVEGSPHPEQALASAMRLPQLAPKSPHLVHMPSHILIHTGDYFGAVQANIEASALGADLMNCCGPPTASDFNYHGHNLKFLIYAAEMSGMSHDALDAASRLNAVAKVEVAALPAARTRSNDHFGYDFLVLARFARWEEILKMPSATNEQGRPTRRYNFARALAFAAKGMPGEGLRECNSVDGNLLNSSVGDPSLSEGPMAFSAKEAFEVSILTNIARGRVARAEHDWRRANEYFSTAIQSQDAAGYQEPPITPWPAREELAAVLLASGDWAGAERVYRESLKQYPASGRAFLGLSQALKQQGKDAESKEMENNFQDAWKHADVALTLRDL